MLLERALWIGPGPVSTDPGTQVEISRGGTGAARHVAGCGDEYVLTRKRQSSTLKLSVKEQILICDIFFPFKSFIHACIHAFIHLKGNVSKGRTKCTRLKPRTGNSI